MNANEVATRAIKQPWKSLLIAGAFSYDGAIEVVFIGVLRDLEKHTWCVACYNQHVMSRLTDSKSLMQKHISKNYILTCNKLQPV